MDSRVDGHLHMDGHTCRCMQSHVQTHVYDTYRMYNHTDVRKRVTLTYGQTCTITYVNT